MIRKAKINDLEKIVEIEKNSLNSTLGIEFLKSELAENEFSQIFVVEESGVICGYLSSRVVDKKAEILNLCIVKKYQQRGLGTKLLNKLKVISNSIILEVRETNYQAINLYYKLGFKEIVKKINYYQNEDGLVLFWEGNDDNFSSRDEL